MMDAGSAGIGAYDDAERARAYDARRGFDPERKERMLAAALGLLAGMTAPGATVLELGAGTGLFTRKILGARRFGEVIATDGAAAMLEVARGKLEERSATLGFDVLDFAAPGWAERYAGRRIDAVTSSMALHHAEDKQAVFAEVYRALAPWGAFVLADHVSGASPEVDALIGRERGRVRLAARGATPDDEPEVLAAFLAEDARKQAAEGNRCESLGAYLRYLSAAGFRDADCLWRDSWLAVFVARK